MQRTLGIDEGGSDSGHIFSKLFVSLLRGAEGLLFSLKSRLQGWDAPIDFVLILKGRFQLPDTLYEIRYRQMRLRRRKLARERRRSSQRSHG